MFKLTDEVIQPQIDAYHGRPQKSKARKEIAHMKIVCYGILNLKIGVELGYPAFEPGSFRNN